MGYSTNLFMVLFAVVPCRSFGQAAGELGSNDIRFRVFSNGYIGASDVLTPEIGVEVPQGSGTSALYGAGLWMAGTSAGGGLHTAVMLYNVDPAEADFFPGPLTVDGTASTTSTVSAAYDRVWVVDRADIAQHLAYHQCLDDPDCDIDAIFPGGYVIPQSIMDWPAMNPTNGYSTFLAPFFDFNSDVAYDAEAGDAPCILGDQAFFLVFNDNLAPHAVSLGSPFGIEAQVMGFVFEGDGSALENTVFLRYHLINRSTNTYEDFRVGFFNDFDLGCPDDDFLGTDPSRNLQYIYNISDVDSSCLGALGYGAQPPAMGMVVLKGPLMEPNGADDALVDGLPAWNGMGFGDMTFDNERIGLTSSMPFNRPASSTVVDPFLPVHFTRYLNATWQNGIPLTYGEEGYSADGAAVPCRFAFPGVNDPVGAGTNGMLMAPWSEPEPPPTFRDRRAITGIGPVTLEPGEHVDLLFAYVYARAGSGGAFASVAALQARVDSVRAFAQTLPIWDTPENQPYAGMCMDYATIGIAEVNAPALTFFPSPAADIVHFAAPLALVGGTLTLRDATGRTILQQRIQPDRNSIDVRALAKGVYLYEAVARNSRFTGRIVKE
jgi:hypothetical protein